MKKKLKFSKESKINITNSCRKKFLRYGLGGYPSWKSNDLPKNALTLRDIGELIRRAGRDAGFVVQSEYKVKGIKGRKNVSKIDWIWLDPKYPKDIPVIAFETEGMGVYPKSIISDEKKFKACNAAYNALVIFQVDHDFKLKRKPLHTPNHKKWIKKHSPYFPGKIYLDKDLMDPGGIELLQKKAKEILRKKRQKKSKKRRGQLS